MMFKRCPISPTLRFRVLQRDGHRCQYCGARAPDAVLEVDHIRPVSLGGRNAEGNLLTACFDCNRGKRAKRVHPLYAQKAAIIAVLEDLPSSRPFSDLLPAVHAAAELLSAADALGEAAELVLRACSVEDWLSRAFQQLALDLNSEAIRWVEAEAG